MSFFPNVKTDFKSLPGIVSQNLAAKIVLLSNAFALFVTGGVIYGWSYVVGDSLVEPTLLLALIVAITFWVVSTYLVLTSRLKNTLRILAIGLCSAGVLGWYQLDIDVPDPRVRWKQTIERGIPPRFAEPLTPSPSVARLLECGDCRVTVIIDRQQAQANFEACIKWYGTEARIHYEAYCVAVREHRNRYRTKKRAIDQAEQYLGRINNRGWDNYPPSYRRYQMYVWTMWGASALVLLALFNVIVKFPARPWIKATSQMDQDECYEQAWRELNNGDLQAGVWARLLTKNKGDEEKTRAAYLKERVKQLMATIDTPQGD